MEAKRQGRSEPLPHIRQDFAVATLASTSASETKILEPSERPQNILPANPKTATLLSQWVSRHRRSMRTLPHTRAPMMFANMSGKVARASRTTHKTRLGPTTRPASVTVSSRSRAGLLETRSARRMPLMPRTTLLRRSRIFASCSRTITLVLVRNGVVNARRTLDLRGSRVYWGD